MMYTALILIAVFSALGTMMLLDAGILHNPTFRGRRSLRQAGKWQTRKQEVWDSPFAKKLTSMARRLVFLDQAAKEKLERSLPRAGYLANDIVRQDRSNTLYFVVVINLL